MPDEEGGVAKKYTCCSLITMSDSLKDMGDMIKDANEAVETLKDLLHEAKDSKELLRSIDESVS